MEPTSDPRPADIRGPRDCHVSFIRHSAVDFPAYLFIYLFIHSFIHMIVAVLIRIA